MAGRPSAAEMVATEGLFGGGDGGAETQMMRGANYGRSWA